MTIKICPDCGGKGTCRKCRGRKPYCSYCHWTGICPICWGVSTVPDGDYYSNSWLAGKLEKRGKKIYES